MSGHSKWHSIKHKKGANDAKRGKIFTKHAKLITIAARGGGDPEMNPALRLEIDRAKGVNMPNNNIDRAIKKGTGEDKDGAVLEEVVYEAYGPSGTALIIEAVTDNKNRTLPHMKEIMTKCGGNMAGAGAVTYLFDRKGVISLKAGDKDPDEAELELMDSGADDISREETDEGVTFELTCDMKLLNEVRKTVEGLGFEIEDAQITYLPKTEVKIDSVEDAKKVMKIMDALDDDEDVTNISSNFDISEEILEQIG